MGKYDDTQPTIGMHPMVGMIEMGGTMLTGMANEAAKGLTASGLALFKGSDEATKFIKDWEDVTYEPKSPAGKAMGQSIGKLFSKWEGVAKWVADSFEEVGAPPIVSTAIYTYYMALPDLIGLRLQMKWSREHSKGLDTFSGKGQKEIALAIESEIDNLFASLNHPDFIDKLWRTVDEVSYNAAKADGTLKSQLGKMVAAAKTRLKDVEVVIMNSDDVRMPHEYRKTAGESMGFATRASQGEKAKIYILPDQIAPARALFDKARQIEKKYGKDSPEYKNITEEYPETASGWNPPTEQGVLTHEFGHELDFILSDLLGKNYDSLGSGRIRGRDTRARGENVFGEVPKKYNPDAPKIITDDFLSQSLPETQRLRVLMNVAKFPVAEVFARVGNVSRYLAENKLTVSELYALFKENPRSAPSDVSDVLSQLKAHSERQLDELVDVARNKDPNADYIALLEEMAGKDVRGNIKVFDSQNPNLPRDVRNRLDDAELAHGRGERYTKPWEGDAPEFSATPNDVSVPGDGAGLGGRRQLSAKERAKLIRQADNTVITALQASLDEIGMVAPNRFKGLLMDAKTGGLIESARSLDEDTDPLGLGE
jgi:hypothetical protein